MAYKRVIDEMCDCRAYACDTQCCLITYDTEIAPPERSFEEGRSVHTLRPMFQVIHPMVPPSRVFRVLSHDYDELARRLEADGDRPPIFL